jgi:predicted O-methyltransferase YrrM
MNITSKIKEMEVYAEENDIPIMQSGGLEYIKRKIQILNAKNILELGTAIGYSAIQFASVSDDIKITTIERNEERYNEAVRNVKDINYEDRINIVFGDALDISLTDKYDLIIIDAAKGKNIDFFNKYKSNLNDNGIIIFDNMNFHGLVGKSSEIRYKNLRSLVRKIEEFREFIMVQEDYYTEFIEVGDGLAVCERKKKF